MNVFATQLTAAMKAAKISQAELARQIPTSQASVSHWCVGRHKPRMDQLDRINIILKSKLTLARTITAKDVAAAMGMCIDTLYRAMREGTTDIGFVTLSRNKKKHCYRFYPGVVAEKLGI